MFPWLQRRHSTGTSLVENVATLLDEEEEDMKVDEEEVSLSKRGSIEHQRKTLGHQRLAGGNPHRFDRVRGQSMHTNPHKSLLSHSETEQIQESASHQTSSVLSDSTTFDSFNSDYYNSRQIIPEHNASNSFAERSEVDNDLQQTIIPPNPSFSDTRIQSSDSRYTALDFSASQSHYGSHINVETDCPQINNPSDQQQNMPIHRPALDSSSTKSSSSDRSKTAVRRKIMTPVEKRDIEVDKVTVAKLPYPVKRNPYSAPRDSSSSVTGMQLMDEEHRGCVQVDTPIYAEPFDPYEL